MEKEAMNDEDERVTEFVSILSNAVEREAENKALRAQRDELLEALQVAVEAIESEHPDVLCGAALQARAAIAKAKGE